ncbi:ABC transporter ATP-binding protein [Bordetella genomosp. 2]|uniref:Teichoic acid ABC transporter ATP-binding protein n=2 Tax=Bordetella TaxID=517 RepID=A0A261V7W9_9BORD|nr:ABC transporter ATP-binding protein [Bordetella genomosp. 2]OZI69670.1 teichoic acid ABC transporter ATP-binding protein [Bordetella genomosp. 2]
MSCERVISVDNVSKRFEMYAQPRDRLLQFLSFGRRQYFKEFWALRDVSLHVCKGETVGILGRNGSGKSTLLQIIAGTLSPTTGDVDVKGKLAALLELGSGFNPEFTGRENVYLNGSVLGFSKAQMDARFDEIAAFADIGEHLDQPVKTYSSGMYVRLAFAVQACVQPDILIVDEALSVGDEKFQRKCFDYIEGLRAAGCAILIVTHSTSTVEKFCQRAALLHRGELHALGPAKEVIDQYHALLYSDEKTYLRYLNASQPQQAATDAESASPAEQPEQAAEDGDARALIRGWQARDERGEPCEAFQSGQKAVITVDVDVFAPITMLQAGLLIRTIEGVSAFGTSTMYHGTSYPSPQRGDRLRIEFDLDLTLGEGTYFATLAIAEEVTQAHMEYLDRKTDAIILKISQRPLRGGGIAALRSSVSVAKL